MWGQLVRLGVSLDTTLTEWKTLIGGLRALESGRIDLTLRDPEDTDVESPMSVDECTLPNLNELDLQIRCDSEVGNVLDGVCLPVLKTFILRTNRLTLSSLHRLVRATPQLERIQVSSFFPAMDTQTDRLDFSFTGPSLVHLRQIVIDIPELHHMGHSSMAGYVDGLLRWKARTAHVDLPWVTNWVPNNLIESVRSYLDSQGVVDITLRRWDFGCLQVNVGPSDDD
jgi:hypothetical protein